MQVIVILLSINKSSGPLLRRLHREEDCGIGRRDLTSRTFLIISEGPNNE